MISKRKSKIKARVISWLRKFSINKRLSLCFIVASGITILLIGSVSSFLSYKQKEEEARNYLAHTTSQTVNNISSYLYMFMERLDTVAKNKEIIEDLQNYNSVNWDIKSFIENRIRLVMGCTFGWGDSINTAELLSTSDAYFYFTSPISNGNFQSSALLSKLEIEVACYTSKKEVGSDDQQYIIFARGIMNADKELVGGLLVALNHEFINKVCLENVNMPGSNIMLIDENNSIIAASEESLVQKKFETDNKNLMTSYKEIANTNFRIVNTIPYSYLMSSSLRQLQIAILLAAFIAILAYLFAYIVTKSITKPVRNLISVMKENSIRMTIEDNGKDEYTEVIAGFNKMNERIMKTVHEFYSLKLKESELNAFKKEVELSALQQQINPHFLYNTLESIYWDGQLQGDDDISEMVHSLGQYLRTIINKGREHITIKREIDSVNNYVFLQNKRFDDRIDCKWTVPEELLKVSVLKLILQPIIEDIISGCFELIDEKIENHIEIIEINQDIKIRLHGNGVSLILKLCKEQKAKIFGITNVEERLKLYFGSQYGVEKNYDMQEIIIIAPIVVPDK